LVPLQVAEQHGVERVEVWASQSSAMCRGVFWELAERDDGLVEGGDYAIHQIGDLASSVRWVGVVTSLW